MVQTELILLIAVLTFNTIVSKRQLSDYERIQMLARDLEAITNLGGGAVELQEHLDDVSSFSANTKHVLKHLPEIKSGIQEVFDVRYKLVKKLKNVVEDLYRKSTELAQSFLVDCYKITNESVAEEGHIFPFKVDYDKICLFSVPSDEDRPSAKLPPTERLLKTFRKNAMELTLPTWQYYVMKNGHTYTYPAKPINKNFRPGFHTQFTGIGHELREIVVVIDTSSRMGEPTMGKVTHLDFAKEVAKIVVHYTSDKDRIAVVTLKADKDYDVEDENNCFTRELVLVTKAYYNDLSKFINELQISGYSSYMDGLEFAKHLLDQSKRKRKKIIVFITAVEPAEEDIDGLFSATFSQSPITTYTVDVGNSQKVRSVLEYLSSVSSTKPGLYIHIDYNHTIMKQMQAYRRHAMMPTAAESLTPCVSSAHQDPLGLGVVISIRQPVFHIDEMVGVVGVDMRVKDILYKNPEMQKGVNTYVFVFDRRDDATLLHPLITDMHNHIAEPNYVNIRGLETAADVQGIIDRMVSGQNGQRNITSTRLISMGDIRFQGVHMVDVEAQYSWAAIDGTPLVMCLVAGEDEDIPVYHLPQPIGDIPFLYAKHIESDKLCKSFGRVALEDDTSVGLTSVAFRDPVAYLATEDTRERIQLYTDIVKGKSSEPLLNDGVIDEVAITKLLHDLWTGPQMRVTVTYAVWRYVYLSGGVIRVYPAIVLPDHYEVVGRSWYQKGTGMPGITVISTPYLDAWGGGYVITVSHSLYAGNPEHQHTKGDTIIGVVSVDITIEYFQFLIQELFAECMNENYSCFAIDLYGYVIVRESMLQPPLRNKARKIQDIHITEAEPVISKHLLEHGYMEKQSCFEFSSLRRLYTFKVFQDLQVEHMNESPRYKLWHVPKTNAFILIKDKDKDNKKPIKTEYEHCHNLTDFSKDGPCYVENNIHICPETPLSSDPWLPCTPKPPKKKVPLDYLTEERMRINVIDKCFNYRCREKRHRQECHMVVGCRWCEQNTNGVELSRPFCGEYDKCYHGRIRFPSPYPAGEEIHFGIILFFTIIGASALAVPFGYVVFRYKVSQEERRLISDDEIGVPGPDL